MDHKTNETVKSLPRDPSPEMLAAGWELLRAKKDNAGIRRLGPGLGLAELYRAMHDAA